MNRLPRLLLPLLILGAIAFVLWQTREEPPVAAIPAGADAPNRTTSAPSFDWPVFRGNRQLSGLCHTPAAGLRLRWTITAGSPVKASPIAAGGIVYLGTDHGTLLALRLTDGSQVWKRNLGGGIEAPALYANNVIYLGDLDGVFHALGASDGQEVWNFRTKGQITGSANLAQLSAEAGRAGGQAILFGSHDTHLYALAADRGTLLWSSKTGSFLNGAPALQDSQPERAVMGGCDHFLRVYNPAAGAEVRRIDIGSYIAGSPALGNNRAFFGHYGNEILCADFAAGTILWRYGDRENGQPFFASPALSADAVLIGGRDQHLYCLDQSTGKLRWRFPAEGALDSSPVICHDTVVVCGMDGRIYLVNLRDGTLRARYDAGAPISASPCVSGSSLLTATEDGRLLCFDLLP